MDYPANTPHYFGAAFGPTRFSPSLTLALPIMTTSQESTFQPLTLDMVRDARERIRHAINHTPVLTSTTLNALHGAQLYFKCENFQKVGAFKARGAANAVFSLSDAEAARGVVTHSSGNHAAALARAAKLRGIAAHVVMPNNAPKAKQAAVGRYGGKVVFCEPTLAAREAAAASVMERTGATFIHPYDNLQVMAGQGTAALELLEAVPDLDVLLVQVGGGGLLSGSAVVTRALAPNAKVIAVEPAEADDAYRSVKSGKLIPLIKTTTVADGLRTSLSLRTFAEIQRHVHDVVTVSDEAIIAAMRRMWEVLKIVVEPSGAVPYAAVASAAVNFPGKRIGVMVSGGNLDLDRLPWMTGA